MNDCKEVEIREALPELVHGVLPEPVRLRVQQHLADCGDCAEELAIIRAVLATMPAVKVDTTRITAAIPVYRRRTLGMNRVYLELAAACLVGAIGISTFAIHNSNSTATATRSANAGISLVNTNDLSDDGLAQLTRELDKIQALPTADPESVTPAALESGTEPLVAGDSA